MTKKSSSNKTATSKKKRGTITIKHTNVVLDIDIENRIIQGYVELHLTSKVRKLSQIKLHSHQLVVSKVYFQNVEAKFEQINYLDSPCDPDDESIRDVHIRFYFIFIHWVGSSNRESPEKESDFFQFLFNFYILI